MTTTDTLKNNLNMYKVLAFAMFISHPFSVKIFSFVVII